jgi:bifunctional non-homologous end joining protein LigD
VTSNARHLFEVVRQIGAESIVSKRPGSAYRGGESRDWLKTKCFEVGSFVITGFRELGEGRLEAIYAAEERDGGLRPAGEVRFGLAGKDLWPALDMLRVAAARRGIVPIRSALLAEIKFLGRVGGCIRNGVLQSVLIA